MNTGVAQAQKGQLTTSLGEAAGLAVPAVAACAWCHLLVLLATYQEWLRRLYCPTCSQTPRKR